MMPLIPLTSVGSCPVGVLFYRQTLTRIVVKCRSKVQTGIPCRLASNAQTPSTSVIARSAKRPSCDAATT